MILQTKKDAFLAIHTRCSVSSDPPWTDYLVVCHERCKHDWQTAIDELDNSNSFADGDTNVKVVSLHQLERYLRPLRQTRTVIVVDEYDPGVKHIVRSMSSQIEAHKHKLFMVRTDSTDLPINPEIVKAVNTLDFMTR